jgi:hypothetical protein
MAASGDQVSRGPSQAAAVTTSFDDFTKEIIGKLFDGGSKIFDVKLLHIPVLPGGSASTLLYVRFEMNPINPRRIFDVPAAMAYIVKEACSSNLSWNSIKVAGATFDQDSYGNAVGYVDHVWGVFDRNKVAKIQWTTFHNMDLLLIAEQFEGASWFH